MSAAADAGSGVGPLAGITVRALKWERRMRGRVPSAAARRIEDLFDHPQVLAEGLVAEIDHPAVGRYRGVARPIGFAATPCRAPAAAPQLGQHGEAVLRGLGFSSAEIEALRREGAVWPASAPAAAAESIRSPEEEKL